MAQEIDEIVEYDDKGSFFQRIDTSVPNNDNHEITPSMLRGVYKSIVETFWKLMKVNNNKIANIDITCLFVRPVEGTKKVRVRFEQDCDVSITDEIMRSEFSNVNCMVMPTRRYSLEENETFPSFTSMSYIGSAVINSDLYYEFNTNSSTNFDNDKPVICARNNNSDTLPFQVYEISHGSTTSYHVQMNIDEKVACVKISANSIQKDDTSDYNNWLYVSKIKPLQNGNIDSRGITLIFIPKSFTFQASYLNMALYIEGNGGFMNKENDLLTEDEFTVCGVYKNLKYVNSYSYTITKSRYALNMLLWDKMWYLSGYLGNA